MYSQEEPRNCGAWSFVRPRLEYISGQRVKYSGRPEMPTRAVFNLFRLNLHISRLFKCYVLI